MTEDIKKLTPYSHVRIRPGMYFGSTEQLSRFVLIFENDAPTIQELSWVPALFTLGRELLDNALDEVVAHGYGNKIDICFDPKTMIFSVQDNGRGIPIDIDKIHKIPKVTLALSHTMTGRNFEERGQTAGMNGIGASGVNYCSEYFKVDVWRNSQHFHQDFRESMSGDSLEILKPKIKTCAEGKTGTRVEFKPSSDVFKDITLPEIFVKSRIYEIALANPKVKFTYNGEKIEISPKWEQTLFGKMAIDIHVEADCFSSKFIIVPDFSEKDHTHSLVNNIPTFDGGTHIDYFKKYFYEGLIENLSRESKKRGLLLSDADFKGSLLFNITRMNAPNFDSQSKTKLINNEIRDYFKTAFDDKFFKSVVSKNKEWIEAVYQRCEDRTKKKDNRDADKEARKNKKTKVAELQDAVGRDRSKCILMITEGQCLNEDTEIKTTVDGEWVDKPIKDIDVGDLVIGHTGSVRTVVAKSTKVSKGITLKTKYGDISGSPEHKMLVYDITDETFKFMELSNINSKNMKLVRSKLNQISGYAEIKVTQTFDEKYPIRIDYGDHYQICSETHRYAVFNIEAVKFEMVEARNLLEGTHAMLVK